MAAAGWGILQIQTISVQAHIEAYMVLDITPALWQASKQALTGTWPHIQTCPAGTRDDPRAGLTHQAAASAAYAKATRAITATAMNFCILVALRNEGRVGGWLRTRVLYVAASAGRWVKIERPEGEDNGYCHMKALYSHVGPILRAFFSPHRMIPWNRVTSRDPHTPGHTGRSLA